METFSQTPGLQSILDEVLSLRLRKFDGVSVWDVLGVVRHQDRLRTLSGDNSFLALDSRREAPN